MAPSPEYDKEPKAPDKSATNISSEDSKLLHNLVNDQHQNSDHKTTNTATNSEVENKHVETLDDDKLRALLNEALTYKCPKDREGKSSLFKELLEEVEQDDQQACEAAARSLTGCRGSRRGARGGRPSLPHSNSLQDLVAALAAEPAPRKHHRHHAPSTVAARAIHGGSLPSGVDTSSMVSEEGTRGAGYLATVRCVNPPPLAERRVSASDGNAHELDSSRRSKPMFPMTYTARATLEIGSGSVGSGRAVTTTTASNQVRTLPASRAQDSAPPRAPEPGTRLLHDVDAWYSGLARYSPDSILPQTHTKPSDKQTKQKKKSSTKDSRQSVPNATRLENYCDTPKSDISLRKSYRQIVLPKVPSFNPRNVRNMSIGDPSSCFGSVEKRSVGEGAGDDKVARKSSERIVDEPTLDVESIEVGVSRNDNKTNDTRIDVESAFSESMEDQRSECFQMSDVSSGPAQRATRPITANDDIELEEIVCHRATKDNRDTGFSNYLADQEKLFRVLEATDLKTVEDEYTAKALENNNNLERSNETEPVRKSARDVSNESDINKSDTSRGEAILARRDHTDRYILAELPNNAYIFLTLPARAPPERPGLAALGPAPSHKHKKKKEKSVESSSCAKRKDVIDKNALRALLFENLLKSDRESAAAGAESEVDSAIPFSCITTPEVVASCNTTPSSSHAAVAADPKPEPRAASLAPAPAPPPTPAPAPASSRADAADEQPRAVLASSFSGLPLSRPSFAASSSDDYKVPTHTIVPLLPSFVKSLDENGNSVQGYGSPLSGSSQHKKPRRKKSSKNETVIDCRQIDGYQGDKDVNELLRFIESDRAPKLRKHKDDSDDKGKKRSTERRKQNKPARAASLEEVSRTTLEELTRAPPAKPERRSWGDAAPPPAPDDHDFQTVTKKRKPRRRTEETAARRTRAPSPRAPASAPPSDRSNDSNDDMDSVTSLPAPAPAPPPAAPASYADIARTRHNIPDLIESCNYYAEGEGEARAPAPPDPPPDADSYPALDPLPAPARRPKPAPPARRKERAAQPTPPVPAAECPAPDVVSDRRPPVILLDSAARPRDMDGVTFGFDINEQLLSGAGRRPRCDLLRDAEPAPPPEPQGAGGEVSVRAAKQALRYVPPPPSADHAHLHQIIDFVGTAWEEVVRCGSGKVRYFSE